MTDPAADTPLQQLVFKVHSRCDLACDHCYVYEHADRSWKTRPVVIHKDTVTQTAHRLAEYAEAAALESVSVILHGGEPLLAGPNRLHEICAEFTSALSGVTTLDLRIHTNGIQLSRRHLDVFAEFGVRVSLSLDGDQAANDRHRLDRRGRSSHDRVLRAIGLIQTAPYRHLFGGLLCTVDVRNDPVAVHDALTALDPPRIDYLLPHSTWDRPPPRGDSDSQTPYAEWLLAIFDRWTQQGRKVPVRTFESVLSTLRDGPSLTEAMGLAPSDLAVVETDGSFEQADSLKTAYHGAPATGYDVFRHGFTEVARHPGVRARQLGLAGVSETCRRCPVVKSCGGGLYAHRYSSESGFDNPSVFCADLRALVDGIADRITERSLFPGLHDTDELAFALLKQDRERLAAANERLAGRPDWDETWHALLRLDADEDGAAHLNRLLAHPYVRSSLRRSGQTATTTTARCASVAIAAAVHARAPMRLSWQQESPDLHFPTLGTMTLPTPGRVDATVDGRTVQVRLSDDRTLTTTAAPTSWWRPLATQGFRGSTQLPLLIDDADPWRSVYTAEVAAPLAPDASDAFRNRLRLALSSEPHPPLFLSVVTPLAAGTGVHSDEHGLGALGVAVDADPSLVAAELPRHLRRARLTALSRAAHLHMPGSPAGELLAQASDGLGDAQHAGPGTAGAAAALARAEQALKQLAALPGRQLTESGMTLMEELHSEWRRLV